MSTVWVLDENITYSYVLVFYSDDYFIIGSYHTEPSAFGKYKFENGLLVLYSFSYDPNIKFYEKIFNETGLMQESGDATPAPNEEKVYCVTEEGRKVLTENVKFRKAPSKDADTQISEIYEEMFWNEPYWNETDCLIKGTVIPVYASTERQETIDGMTACWYYVSMPTLSGFNQYGWIFGGFFKDYDESKKDEYAETLRNEFRLSPEQMK